MNLPDQKIKTTLKCLLILWVAGAGFAAGAQIYKHVDEDGKITFTDQPPDDGTATPVEIKPTNTTPPPSPSAYPQTTPEPDDDGADDSAYTVTITSPEDQTIIPRGPGNLSVSASIKPALAPSQKLQLLLDGSPRGEAQRNSSWALTNVFRGEHQLEVAVLDANGEQVAKSDGITIFVFRPSSNDRSNRVNTRPPRPTPN
jgi:hypothetical protein